MDAPKGPWYPAFPRMAERAAQTAPEVAETSETLHERNTRRLPRHIGIIMDGNGRWARQRQLPREKGHSEGAEAVRKIVRYSRKIGVKALTLYAFSSQNWNRPPNEVLHLMQLLRRFLIEERAEIMDNNIRLRTIGDIERLPSMVREPLAELIDDSKANDGMTLCLALSYGGRETIAKTARALAQMAVDGELEPEQIDVEKFESLMPTSLDLPELDLLIRTSGEHRVSNFFLWEVAYAELYFCETLWPDYDETALQRALDAYAGRERRFGLTSEQVQECSDDKMAAEYTPAPTLEVSAPNAKL